MIKIFCNDSDCLIYPENEWRLKQNEEIEEAIRQYEDKNLNLEVLDRLHELFQLLYENKTCPYECMVCSRRIPIDMKSEIMATVAKQELMK